MLVQTKTLTPEQNRAIRLFEERKMLRPTSLEGLHLSDITVSGSQIIIEGDFNRKLLPHGTNWTWHQSNGKDTIHTRQGFVELCKLSPRKSRNVSVDALPSYKLWVFHIKDSDPLLTFLWCEKGKASADSAPPLMRSKRKVRSTSPPLQLSQLSFLKDFLDDPTLAVQFGWTNEPPQATSPPNPSSRVLNRTRTTQTHSFSPYSRQQAPSTPIFKGSERPRTL